MIILAGITIKLALDDNGVIKEAKSSVKDYEIAQDEEQEELENLRDTIRSNRPISKKTGALGAPLNVGDYGREVTNYTAKGLRWRLFYEDENNVYLISETTDGDYPEKNLSLCNYENDTYVAKGNYSSGASVSDQGKALMPLLGGATESKVGTITIGTNSEGTNLLTSSNTNPNILGVAYLCDTSDDGPWKDYKIGNASWAMGAPTIELYTASFNATHQGGNQISLGIGTYGYTDNTDSDWLKKDDNEGIYNLTGGESWWLAGPISSCDDNVYLVYEDGGSFGCNLVDHTYSARPVVCFKKSNFQYQLKAK